MSCVNSQGFGSYSRVCKGLDEENAIFLLHSEKYFGFVRENAFFGARAFLLGFLPSWKKNCFARRRRDAEEEGGDEFFLSKNSASLILCARWVADEFAFDHYLPPLSPEMVWKIEVKIRYIMLPIRPAMITRITGVTSAMRRCMSLDISRS